MKIKLFLCSVLLMPIQTRTTGLELAAGAIVVGAILRTKVVKTMGAVMAGYFLNTPAGKRVSVFMIQKIFGNHQTNNFQLESSTPSMISRFYKSSDVNVFSKASSSVQSIKEKMKTMNPFGRTDSKVNPFSTSYSNSYSSSQSGADFQAHEYTNIFSDFGRKSSDSRVTNVMAQKVSGFCPKIENNYYSGNYWRGFAQGSFASWLSAWFLTRDAKNKEEDLKIPEPVTTHQELASLTEYDLRKF